MKLQDTLFTALDVLLVSTVEEFVDTIDLNCRRKRIKKKPPSIAAVDFFP